MENKKLFMEEVLRLHDSRNHKVTGSLGSYDAYKYMDTKEAGTYKAKASKIIGQDVDALVANRTFMSRNGWFLND